MSVDGREIANLDFPNLIGGPLNAIVEAQAKSALATANFIKEVAFDGDGKAVNVDFTYSRKNQDGRAQDFTLTVPILTMVPIPYIQIEHAEIEFNAKITATLERSTRSSSDKQVTGDAVSDAWGTKTVLKGKTAAQKRSRARDSDSRSFDIRVLVRVRNAELPAGAERLLDRLEDAMEEREGEVHGVSGTIEAVESGGRVLRVSTVHGLGLDWRVTLNGRALGPIVGLDGQARTITVRDPAPPTAAPGDTFAAKPPAPGDPGDPQADGA